MSNKNYGYFGTGSSGYAHYMQSFNETTGSNSYSKPNTHSESCQVSPWEKMVMIMFAPVLLPVYLIALFVKFLFS